MGTADSYLRHLPCSFPFGSPTPFVSKFFQLFGLQIPFVFKFFQLFGLQIKQDRRKAEAAAEAAVAAFGAAAKARITTTVIYQWYE